ncbi:MAG: DUF3047 domain-containing protein [Burkholderiales bacterium]
MNGKICLRNRPATRLAKMHCTPCVILTFLVACSGLAGAVSGAVASTCQERNLDFGREGWAHQPLSIFKRDTVYALAQEEGRTVLRAIARGSASLYVTRFKPAAGVPNTLSWHWKTDALVPGADNRDKKREDAPLRVIVAFDGKRSTLPEAEQRLLKKTNLPYATLMYIWSDHVAVESVIPSAHSSRIKMLVVASGAHGLGSWQSIRRNVMDDYRRAYGAKAGSVLGIGVMTDTDNTSAEAVGQYADIRFECAQ